MPIAAGEGARPLPNQQLGFDAFLAQAEADNHARRFEKEAAHLPGGFDGAVAFLRRLIEAHAVQRDRSLFSEIGYRTFLGIYADAAPGLTPKVFVARCAKKL